MQFPALGLGCVAIGGAAAFGANAAGVRAPDVLWAIGVLGAGLPALALLLVHLFMTRPPALEEDTITRRIEGPPSR